MKLDLDTVRAFFGRAPFIVDLGVDPVAVGEGRVTTRLPVQPRFLQHTGHVHAGVMATLADHTMGAAAQTCAPEGSFAITAELKTSLLSPAAGETLECAAQVLRAGRNLSFTEAEVWTSGAAGRTLVMKASATMAMVQGRR